MKLGIFGNTVNIWYPICKAIRKINPHTELILDSLENYPTHLPIWCDLDFEIPTKMARNKKQFKKFLNELASKNKWKSPNWVKNFPEKTSIRHLFNPKLINANIRLIKLFLQKPSIARLLVLKEASKNYPRLAKYDSLIVCGMGPFHGYLVNVPYWMLPNGGDLTELPFQTNDPNPIYKERSIMQNIGIKNAKGILGHSPDYPRIIKKLQRDVRFHFWSTYVADPDIFKPMNIKFDDFEQNQDFVEKLENKIVFYLPSRIEFDTGTGGKGSHKAIRAFAKLSKHHPEVFLIVHDWYLSNPKAMELIKELDIENNIYFNKNLLSKRRLAKFINSSDAVLNNFGQYTYGTLDIETLACGKPLITNFEMDYVKKIQGDEPPILKAYSEEEIYDRMIEIINDKVSHEFISKGPEWVSRHHGKNQVKFLLEHLQSTI